MKNIIKKEACNKNKRFNKHKKLAFLYLFHLSALSYETANSLEKRDPVFNLTANTSLRQWLVKPELLFPFYTGDHSVFGAIARGVYEGVKTKDMNKGQDIYEGGAGLFLRTGLSDDWVLGNAFFVGYQRTRYKNHFYDAVLHADLLNPIFRISANFYHAFGLKKEIHAKEFIYEYAPRRMDVSASVGLPNAPEFRLGGSYGRALQQRNKTNKERTGSMDETGLGEFLH